MKKWCLFLSVYALVCALAGCGGELVENAGPENAEKPASAQAVDERTLCGRVIDGARGEGEFLLLGGEDGVVYTIDRPEESEIRNGDLVKISFGGEMTDLETEIVGLFQMIFLTLIQALAGIS